MASRYISDGIGTCGIHLSSKRVKVMLLRAVAQKGKGSPLDRFPSNAAAVQPWTAHYVRKMHPDSVK